MRMQQSTLEGRRSSPSQSLLPTFKVLFVPHQSGAHAETAGRSSRKLEVSRPDQRESKSGRQVCWRSPGNGGMKALDCNMFGQTIRLSHSKRTSHIFVYSCQSAPARGLLLVQGATLNRHRRESVTTFNQTLCQSQLGVK